MCKWCVSDSKRKLGNGKESKIERESTYYKKLSDKDREFKHSDLREFARWREREERELK